MCPVTSNPVFLQPVSSPRLGGEFCTIGLDSTVFTVWHVVRPCTLQLASPQSEECDQFLIQGLGSSTMSGSFSVIYRVNGVEEETQVLFGKNYYSLQNV